MASGELGFEKVYNGRYEEHFGYTRCYRAAGFAGAVLFGFEGDRDDRTFLLTIEANHDDGKTEVAYVQADTSVELVDLMNDDESLGWVINEAGYQQPLADALV